MKIKARKSLKSALIFMAGVLIVIFSSVAIHYYHSQSSINYHKYSKNKYGETYGISSDDIYNDGKEPDLIKAMGIDGKTVGYIRSSDINGIQPKNPNEAIEYMTKYKGDRIIPLYDYNGKNVIGKFRIGL